MFSGEISPQKSGRLDHSLLQELGPLDPSADHAGNTPVGLVQNISVENIRSRSPARAEIGAEVRQNHMKIALHDRHTAGVESQHLHVLEDTDHVALGGLLQRKESRGSEPHVIIPVLSNLTHQTLERSTTKEETSRLHVGLDLTQGHNTRSEAAGALDAGRTLALLLVRGETTGFLLGHLRVGLGCNVLSGRLPTGRAAGGLLGASHEQR